MSLLMRQGRLVVAGLVAVFLEVVGLLSQTERRFQFLCVVVEEKTMEMKIAHSGSWRNEVVAVQDRGQTQSLEGAGWCFDVRSKDRSVGMPCRLELLEKVFPGLEVVRWCWFHQASRTSFAVVVESGWAGSLGTQ